MKTSLYYIMFFIFFENVDGQSLYFNNRYGFDGFKEAGGNIIPVADGYLLLEEPVDSNWNYYLGIMKIDNQGNEIWKKLYGKYGYNFGAGSGGSLIKTFDGNFVDAGTYSDTSGKYYAHLIKFNEVGDTLWSRKYRSGNNQGYGAYQCKQTSDSGLIIIGVSDATDVNGNILFFKTDLFGNLQWQKTYSGGGIEYGFNVDNCADGGFILGGYQNPGTLGGYDAYVIKTDSVGNLKWQKRFGGANDDGDAKVISGKDGGFIIATYEESSIPYWWQLYFLKLDNSGNILWEKKIGKNTYGANPWVVMEDNNGNITAAGNSSIGDTTMLSAHIVGFIVKLNSLGDSLWYKIYDIAPCKNSDNYLRDIKPTSDGGYITAGFVQPASFCGDTGSQDMWVVKVDSCGCLTPNCNPPPGGKLYFCNRQYHYYFYQ